MSPSSSLNNVADRRDGYAEISPNLRVTSGLFSGAVADKFHPSGVKLGLCARLTPLLPTFGDLIPHIIQVGSLKKMVGINACGIVTAVQNVKVGVNATTVELEGYPVRSYMFPVSADYSVTESILATRPKPTGIGFTFF